MHVYVDGSALSRSILDVSESASWREWISSGDHQLVASEISVTEFRQSAQLEGADARKHADNELERIEVAKLSDETLLEAATMSDILPPFTAIHMATARAIAGLDGIATYDQELATAAAHYGFAVISPGMDGNWWEGHGQGIRKVAAKLAVVAKTTTGEQPALPLEQRALAEEAAEREAEGPAPEEPAPEEPAPEEPAPGKSAPSRPASIKPAPIKPASIKPASTRSTPARSGTGGGSRPAPAIPHRGVTTPGQPPRPSGPPSGSGGASMLSADRPARSGPLTETLTDSDADMASLLSSLASLSSLLATDVPADPPAVRTRSSVLTKLRRRSGLAQGKRPTIPEQRRESPTFPALSKPALDEDAEDIERSLWGEVFGMDDAESVSTAENPTQEPQVLAQEAEKDSQ